MVRATAATDGGAALGGFDIAPVDDPRQGDTFACRRYERSRAHADASCSANPEASVKEW